MVLVLVLSSAVITVSIFGQEAAVDQTKKPQPPAIESPRNNPLLQSQKAVVAQTSEPQSFEQTNDLQKLHERVSTIEGRLQEFSQAIQASIQSTTNYTGYVTFVFTLAIGLSTLIGGIAAYWITSSANEKVKQVETAREQMTQQVETAREQMTQQVKTVHEQIRQAENELASAIAIARAVPALLRSNLEGSDLNRKKVHAEEAYHYIAEVESKGYTDSHLLNWKAYALRRMDRNKLALEAAQEALKRVTKLDDPQKARAFYNIACYCALFGKHEEALDALEQAVIASEWNKRIAREDPDFDSIRNGNNRELKQRFEQMVG
jgi:tetratricopeptide (TPR) repeat protein